MTKINLNDSVLIRITDNGWRIYDEHYKPYVPHGVSVFRPKTEDDGRVKMQLHEVMQVFGRFMYVGRADLPFGTEMEIAP